MPKTPTRRAAVTTLLGATVTTTLCAPTIAQTWQGGTQYGSYMVDASDFGLKASNSDNTAQLQSFINYLAQNNAIGRIGPGIFNVLGALSEPPAGAIHIQGSGKDATVFRGRPTTDIAKRTYFLRPQGPLSLSGLRMSGFKVCINTRGPGDISVTDCRIDRCDVFIGGFGVMIDADNFTVSDCIIEDLDAACISVSNVTIRQRAVFARNRVRDVKTYLYRMTHDAPLYFEGNDIDGVRAGKTGVARVVMSGGATSYIRNNTIKNIIATQGDSVLIYWSTGDAVITGNTFGKFASEKNTFLVKEKSRRAKSLTLSGNLFLGGDDLADFNGVVYCITGQDENPALKLIQDNRGTHLRGKLLMVFAPPGYNLPPGNFVIKGNQFDRIEGPALVSVVQGVSDLFVLDNRVGMMSNADRIAINGTAVATCLIGASLSASDSRISSVHSSNNIISFAADTPNACLFYVRAFSRAEAQTGAWHSISDTVINANHLLALSTTPSGKFYIQNAQAPNLSGKPVKGTATRISISP